MVSRPLESFIAVSLIALALFALAAFLGSRE
jgi:hypothetical protein